MSYRAYSYNQPLGSRPPGLFAHLPPVVAALIKINVGVFLAMWLLRLDGLYALLALSYNGLFSGMLWQPVTYMFLHGGFMHLLFNMFTLFFLGPETERAMGSGTSWPCICSAACSAAWAGSGSRPIPCLCVSASGCIYGVLAAFATLYPRRRLTASGLFIFPVTLMAWQLVAGLALVEFMLAGRDQASGIAHTAHLAGAFAGFLYIDQLFESTHLRRLCGAASGTMSPSARGSAPPLPTRPKWTAFSTKSAPGAFNP